MPTRLLVMGSIMAVGAVASLLLFNQNNSRSPISIISTPSGDRSTQIIHKKKNSLAPLLPSLAKPPTPTTELSLKKPQPEQKISSKLLPTPTITSAKPKQFVPNNLTQSTLQKPLPIITPTIRSSLSSRRFTSTGEAELSTSKSPLVFTHRSRPILPPIDNPIVPTSLVTPLPIAETPTPNILRESLATPMPIAETPTPLKPLAIPTLIQPLATPTPTTSTNLLATPTPIQVTPRISPSPDQLTP